MAFLKRHDSPTTTALAAVGTSGIGDGPREIMVRVPTHREPTHPGEMLVEEFLKPMGLTQRDLADGILVPYQRVNELARKRRGITPSTALRLARYFGMSPDFWLSLQLRWDLYHARAKESATLRKIKQVRSRSAA